MVDVVVGASGGGGECGGRGPCAPPPPAYPRGSHSPPSNVRCARHRYTRGVADSTPPGWCPTGALSCPSSARITVHSSSEPCRTRGTTADSTPRYTPRSDAPEYKCAHLCTMSMPRLCVLNAGAPAAWLGVLNAGAPEAPRRHARVQGWALLQYPFSSERGARLPCRWCTISTSWVCVLNACAMSLP